MASHSIADRLAEAHAQIARACRNAGRAPASVTLVAVSKAVRVDGLTQAHDAGQRHFGESYVQEALPKIAAFAAARRDAAWHFVGPVQSNKTAALARHFDWVHAIDRDRIALRLSDQRPADLPPLNVCVQVNISGEVTKSGAHPEAVAALCRSVAALPRLRLRGLMAIPAPAAPGTDARAPFRRLRELHDLLTRGGLELDTLSAGMSDDFPAAIAEGSTLVRLGTAIFGNRPGRTDLRPAPLETE